MRNTNSSDLMFPNERATLSGKQIRSSLHIGTISTE